MCVVCVNVIVIKITAFFANRVNCWNRNLVMFYDCFDVFFLFEREIKIIRNFFSMKFLTFFRTLCLLLSFVFAKYLKIIYDIFYKLNSTVIQYAFISYDIFAAAGGRIYRDSSFFDLLCASVRSYFKINQCHKLPQ